MVGFLPIFAGDGSKLERFYFTRTNVCFTIRVQTIVRGNDSSSDIVADGLKNETGDYFQLGNTYDNRTYL